MLVHDVKSRETKAINYREMAPAAASRDMFLDKDGNLIPGSSTSYKAAGVPGTVAGLVDALEKYGTMSLKEVICPSIKLAKKGFPITHDLARVLGSMENRLKQWPESAAIYYKADGSRYEPGEIWKQPDLARTLKRIAKKGKDGFYKGTVAELIADDMKKNNGLITEEDMANYVPQWTDVIWGEYLGYQIASMPPPSSGGVHVIQMLNILEDFPLKDYGHNAAASIHVMAEAMRLAYADRSKHLGDPLFWDVPTEELTSEEYADFLVNKINEGRATPSSEVAPGNPADYESEETTHFSVIDKYGNVVSNTYTLNFSFGNGAVVKGTGILLNNEMDDFSAKPGTPNAFGMLGGDANAIQPGKRPLSSMTPTIVFHNDKPFIATGSPGGSRIITTVLQVIMNVLQYDMNVAEASHAPRIHHQWYPDKLFIEKNLNPDTRRILESLGHILEVRNAMGSTQTIMIKDGLLYGASDPRRPDGTTLGY
jgi:gamma-glutamyltranspeptidase/glutathione hydrolase